MKTTKLINKVTNNILLKYSKKNMFLKSSDPSLNTGNSFELPERDTQEDSLYESRNTYTKWFNPNNFDPRAPDYVNSIRGDWSENPTREEIGSGKYRITYKNAILIIKFIICLNKQ